MKKNNLFYFTVLIMVLSLPFQGKTSVDNKNESTGSVEVEISFNDSAPESEVYIHLSPPGGRPFYTTNIEIKPGSPLPKDKPLILNYQEMRRNRIYHLGRYKGDKKILKGNLDEVIVGSYQAHILTRPARGLNENCSKFEAPSPDYPSKKETFIHTCVIKKTDSFLTVPDSVSVSEGQTTKLKIQPFSKDNYP